MLWLANGDDSGELTTAPAMRKISRNFVFRNSFRGPTSNKWCLDKDDGSSNYEESGNVVRTHVHPPQLDFIPGI